MSKLDEGMGEGLADRKDSGNGQKPPAGPGSKPKFSLLTMVFLLGMAGIGLSHVQTTYRYEQVREEADRLKQLQTKLADTDFPSDVIAGLDKIDNVHRLIDLAEMSESEFAGQLNRAGIDSEPFLERLKDAMSAWQVRFRE